MPSQEEENSLDPKTAGNGDVRELQRLRRPLIIMAQYLLYESITKRASCMFCRQCANEVCRMKNKGFTLIEIIVVTLLIGILATLGSYAILKGVNNGRIKNAEAELEMLSAAVLQLAWDTGKWPNGAWRNAGGSVEMWDITYNRSGLLGTDGSYDHWKGPYFEGPLIDPWGNPYFFDPDYSIDGVMRPVVGSFGPNGMGPNMYDADDIYIRLDD
jgi:general secretion pathway protein G